MNPESNPSVSAGEQVEISWGKCLLLVSASLTLAYVIALVTFMIRWIHFWMRGPYFVPYLSVFLTTQALFLLWWTCRHHTGPLPFLSTTLYAMAAGYVGGLTAMVLYPVFQMDGFQHTLTALRFPTIEAAIAFFWFPVRLFTWAFGGIAGLMLTVLSRRMSRSIRFRPSLVVIALLFSVILIAGTNVSESDRSRDGLIGPVRQVTTVSGLATTIATYDRTGMLLETENRIKPPPEEPEAQERVQKLIYLYSKGRRVREMLVEPDGQQYLSRRYGYDAAGRKRAEAAYHMCGTFSSLHVLSYDPKGRVGEDLFYQYRSIAKQRNEYDEGGSLKTRFTYKNGALQSTTRFKIDKDGRISEQVEDLSNASLTRTYKYDDRGNPIVEDVVSNTDRSRSERTTFAYDYDEVGNWTRRAMRRVGNLDEPVFETTISERTITYH